MAIVSSNHAAKILLEPLGINFKHLIRCHIFFDPDDIVLIKAEYMLEEPSKKAVSKWKRYALAELKDTPEQVFEDLVEAFDDLADAIDGLKK